MKTLSRRLTPKNLGPAGIVWPKPISELETMPLFAYGASYEAADLQCTALNRALLKLQGRHRMGTLTNNALSGSGVDSMAIRALGNTATKWVAGTKGLIYFNPIHNSLFGGGFTSAKAIAAITNGVHACLCAFASSSKVESGVATKTGTWSSDSNSSWSGGNAALTSTTGDTIDFTVVVNATGTVDIIVNAIDSASAVGIAFPPSPFTVWVDGVQVGGTRTESDQAYDTIVSVENNGIGRYAVTLTGLTAASHTIRVKKEAGAGTTYLWVDQVLVRSLPSVATPVVMFKMPKLDWAVITAYGFATITDSELAAANAMLDAEAAQFSNVILVDPTQGWDYTKHIGAADGIHPNDRGMALYTSKTEQAIIRELGWRTGLHTGV